MIISNLKHIENTITPVVNISKILLPSVIKQPRNIEESNQYFHIGLDNLLWRSAAYSSHMYVIRE